MFRLFDIVYENCLFRQFKVSDLLFVEYKCLNDEQKLIVQCERNFFMYILGGKKIFQTLHSTYQATAGQAVFVRKGANIVHQFYDKEFCGLMIFIPDEFIIDTIRHSGISRAFEQMTETTDSVIPVQPDPALNTYFESVFAYFGMDEKPPAALLELKFKELILYILSSGKNQPLSRYLISRCATNTACIREIMERNFIYKMKMTEFAKLTGRSLATFKRDFIATFQTTPGRWLMKKKLEYARQLLAITDKNINELSFDAGFESPSHFIRIFKGHFKVTPLQYKKQVGKKPEIIS